MINVLIADDDPDTLTALKRNIDGQEGIHVLATACNGKEAVEMACRLRPDVVLMDNHMPIMNGVEASNIIKGYDKIIKVLILTLFKENNQVVKAFEYKCDGFLFKGMRSDEIAAIIKNTYMGFNRYDSAAQEIIFEYVENKTTSTIHERDQSELQELTPRELDMVRLVTAGKKDSEISKELFISEGYVKNQLAIIREKLGFRNSKELAVWGARMGL